MASWSWRSSGALLTAAAIFILSWLLTRGGARRGESTPGTVHSTAPTIEVADISSHESRVTSNSVLEFVATDSDEPARGVAFELRGVVIDESGAAVEGAEVRAGSVRGVSARGGEFALDLPARDLVDDEWMVIASTSDHRIGATRARIGSRDPLVVPMTKARTLTISVRKAGGGAAAGVIVAAHVLDDAADGVELRSGVTSADGSVALKDLPAIPLVLRTRSADTVPTRQVLGRGFGEQAAYVVVAPGPSLSLVVVDDEHHPVAGARAVVTDVDYGGAIELTSDANGRFPATGFASDPQRIVVTHPTHATAVETVQPTRSSEKEIVLHAAGAIEVAIETPLWQREGDGAWIVEARPIDRAELPRLREAAGSRRVAVLDGANPEATYAVAARYFGRTGAFSIGPLRIADSVRIDRQHAATRWKLPELFRVSANCRDAKGVPIRDAAVSLVAVRPSAPTSSIERCDFTADEFGSAVGFVVGGTYRIEARSPTASAELRQTEVEVKEECNLDLVFTSGRTIRGTVASRDGKPLCRKVVEEGSGPTRTAWCDGAGRFELHGIPTGACRVRAIGKYGEPAAASADVVVATSDVDDCHLVLDSGRIVGRITGQHGERTRVTASVGGDAADVVVTWTDVHGDFRIDDVSGGEWSVLAETESEYGKGVASSRQAGGVGRWSGVIRGDTNVHIEVVWQ